MKKHLFSTSTSYLFFLVLSSGPVFATDQSELAEYFNIPPEMIYIECPQKTYEITENGTLKVCLDKANYEKRCEISLNNLSKKPWINDISFSFRLSGDALKEKYHYSLLQIHVYPDTSRGEKWRCPPFTVDMTADTLNIHNRWDKEALSKTYHYNCDEPGSSIKGRELYRKDGLTTDTWYPFSLASRFSYEEDGLVTLKVLDDPEQEFTGPNIYNDKRIPFVKLGVYKPSSWERNQKEICVEYQNIQVNLHK